MLKCSNERTNPNPNNHGKLQWENEWTERMKTRRERLKSALYLSLKKRKTFFWKKLEIFEKKFSFGKCRVVPKNVKGGTLFDL